ncbi:ARM repeat-containing protein [Pleurotus eryngii]|uniref:MMS19 nucleotide excision repair protein n=1 Tax=Pleurotus eryngii TaxID=5323 RepID=A0A9P5ZML0_PLEER|nr:ARM repeat-containing protein [Pleurotus eryngii]
MDDENSQAKSLRLVQTWMAATSKKDQIVGDIVTAVSSAQFALLDLVKSLGGYLTSEDDELRTKGVGLLSSVLHQGNLTTNRQTVHALTLFYCGKLDDTETIVPALDGLVALSKQPNLSSEDAVAVIRAIFTYVKMKALVQAVRYHVFSIVDTLLTKHRKALQGMGTEFISGYVSLAEGEKDPRNLLVAFAIARVLLIEFDVSHHVENFFNITFCYFPISFRPTPSDPYGITAEDLKSRLRDCLSAHPSFGPLAIPLFLEKLTAGSPVTKRDTLESMTVCLPVYGAEFILEHAKSVWNSLKIEVLQPTDPSTEAIALDTIKSFIRVISSTDAGQAASLRDIIYEECVQKLQEPEKSQAKPSMKLLCTMMTAKSSSSEVIVSKAFPLLFKLVNDPTETANRPSVILLLCRLTDACHDVTILLPFKDELMGVLTAGFESSTCRQQTLALLQVMLAIRGLLTTEEIGYFIRTLTETFLQPSETNDEFNDRIVTFLSMVNETRHLGETALPLLFSALPDRPLERDAAVEHRLIKRVLAALPTLCTSREHFETLYIRLTTKFEIVSFPVSGNDLVDREAVSAYGFALLKALSTSLEAKIAGNHVDTPKYEELLLPRLYNWFIYSATSTDHQFLAVECRVVSLAAEIVSMLSRASNPQRQKAQIDSVYSAFFQGDPHAIAFGFPRIPKDAQFAPFSDSASDAEKNLVPLAAACFYPLYPEVQLPVDEIHPFIKLLLNWGVYYATNEHQAQSAWGVGSSILNKHIDDSPSAILGQLSEFWRTNVLNKDINYERRCASIRAWIWVGKALLRRNHPQASQLSAQLMDLFEETPINQKAALAIGDSLCTDLVITKSNHAVVKMLHVQKYVNTLLPLILSNVNTSKPAQISYLAALSSLVQSVPCAIYIHRASELMPLLICSLELPDVDIRTNSINILFAISGEQAASKILAQHASTLIDSMLNIGLDSLGSSTLLRIAALRYLGLLPSLLSYSALHPHKARVLWKLAKSLDDVKRSVRREGVNTRTKWARCSG